MSELLICVFQKSRIQKNTEQLTRAGEKIMNYLAFSYFCFSITAGLGVRSRNPELDVDGLAGGDGLTKLTGLNFSGQLGFFELFLGFSSFFYKSIDGY